LRKSKAEEMRSLLESVDQVERRLRKMQNENVDMGMAYKWVSRDLIDKNLR
jgi:translation initiation factor 2B subunit (eIF-2B alpha/beta/delta family)